MRSKQRGAELRAGAAFCPCDIPERWAELRAASLAGLSHSWVAPAILAPSDSHGTMWGKVLPAAPAPRGRAAWAGEQLPYLAPLCPAPAWSHAPTAPVSMTPPGRIQPLLSPTLPYLCPHNGPAQSTSMPAARVAQHSQGLPGPVTKEGRFISGGRDRIKPCISSQDTARASHRRWPTSPPPASPQLSCLGALPTHHQDLGLQAARAGQILPPQLCQAPMAPTGRLHRVGSAWRKAGK